MKKTVMLAMGLVASGLWAQSPFADAEFYLRFYPEDGTPGMIMIVR